VSSHPPFTHGRTLQPGALDAEDLTPGREIVWHFGASSPLHCRVNVGQNDNGIVRLAVHERGDAEDACPLWMLGLAPRPDGDWWEPERYVTAAVSTRSAGGGA
jgi:hypothetical protein